MRIVEREIRLAGPNSTAYSYAVAGDAAEIAGDISSFTTMLIAALGVLAIGLIVATLFQVRFGLRPLRVIRREVAAVRAGEAEELDGCPPDESCRYKTSSMR